MRDKTGEEEGNACFYMIDSEYFLWFKVAFYTKETFRVALSFIFAENIKQVLA